MKNLQRIIDAYAQMDARRKQEALVYFEALAKTFPDRERPRLLLVANNTRPEDCGEGGRLDHKGFATIIVS